ncbi:PTS fructose-like transporter subunit IIB [Pararhodospirillum photometricum]|uniref:protein-N(pi)-phosphohistidine--D-fructose phosphotransferase n=1 Tax=Pararhodospirillum photometricum DSM 122 TaxID=1150469 RepID=H6SK15_PARPM|nr:PTS fructose-like transporter subunit IIB [Pararhodospirillum photometricum]CCG08330.1 PTS fructose IIC component [Pararhodospirillum photometricum DSM 122]
MTFIVAVTACPTGIAHTHLAAEALEATARRRGHTVRVERQSAQGIEHPLSEAEIAKAEVVLIAADIRVDESRFAGKRMGMCSTSEAIRHPELVLARLLGAAWEDVAAPALVQQGLTIVAVTACPTGIAHTFMAADALKKAAAAAGHTLHVETQGSVGAKTPLSEADIASADLVIIAADTHVDDTRFQGRRVYKAAVGEAVKHPQDVLSRAMAEATVLGAAKPAYREAVQAAKASHAARSGPYKHLLTGVSYMLPIVVAGGLLIALSFVFGIKAFEQEGTLAAALMSIGGGAAFKIMVPVLAGFIAYSIADRPGLAPGLIGGMLAVNLNAGFLGGIVAGFLAGYVARWLRDKITLPAALETLKPVLIIPLLSTLVVGLGMVYVIGTPVAYLMTSLTGFLSGLGTTNAVMLGLLLGGMMAVDMGGPVNKAAYAFGVSLLTTGTTAPMAAVMAAGMTPPLGLALATLIARNRFTPDEREAGKAAAMLGLSFITEGAIPFAAKDPARVIPSLILGSAVTGALSMALGCTLMAPHGGIFVLAIPNAVGNLAQYALAILAGTLVTTASLVILKKPLPQTP